MKSLLNEQPGHAGVSMNVISSMKPVTNALAQPARGTAFGCPRDFLENQFVYTVISPRARGLSVGVNMNPDKQCNFDCVYCEVSRNERTSESRLDVPVMISELERTFGLVKTGGLRARP